MNKSIKIILVLAFCGLLPLSCLRCDDAACECDDFSPAVDFTIEEMDIFTRGISNNPIDTSLFYQHDSIVKSIYITETENVAIHNHHFNLNFSFANTAFACSPVPPQAVQRIDGVTITSNTNVEFPFHSFSVGDTINDYFEIKNHYRDFFEEIPEFIEYQSAIDRAEQFWIRFAESPGETVSLNINIEMILNDGSVFYFSDEQLKIK